MDRNFHNGSPPMSSAARKSDRRIGIIGGGPGGLCTAIKLKEAGYENFTIFERSKGVGGTWNTNRYPGLACDVPTHLYSFSFELNPSWTREYAPQPEILTYMEQVAHKYGLMPHVRLETAVKSAYWDEECTVWRVVLSTGETETFDILVSAIGMFNERNWPDIPGLQSFQGTKFHSGEWNEEHSLENEAVGVIGNAASAVQFLPRIAAKTKQLYVFQRTPSWVLPKDDPIFDEETLAARQADPLAPRKLRMKVYRDIEKLVEYLPEDVAANTQACLENLMVVKNPETRRKLTPDYSWGCQRPLFSNEFYPVFNLPQVEVVDAGIERVTPQGILTRDGVERKLDTLICATGYSVRKYLTAIDVTGRKGLHITDAWKHGAEAYLGITTSGFPNLFMIYGPNTNNGSILFMLECQAAYIVRRLEWMHDNDLAWIDVKRDVEKRYNEELQAEIRRNHIWTEGCRNYYHTDEGRNVTQCPYGMNEYRARTMAPDPDAFHYQHGAPLSR